MMRHVGAFVLCLLGTLPLGCVLGKYDSDWNKDNGAIGGGLAVGGSSNTDSATGGSAIASTSSSTVGGDTSTASVGGATSVGGTSPTVGGGTSTGLITGGSNAAAGGGSNVNTGGAANVGGIGAAGGTSAVGGNASSGGTAANLGGNSTFTAATGGLGAGGGNDTTSPVQTGGVAPGAGGGSVFSGGVGTTGGNNGAGGIVTGGSTSTGGSSGSPRLAKAIATGKSHTCAVLTDGSVYCWGNNCDGELGDGTQLDGCGTDVAANMPKNLAPVQVKDLSGVTALTCGYNHSCAVADGKVYCWGSGGDGQLGNGNSGTSYMSGFPVAVSGITNATAVAAGEKFTCALLGDATVSCWGDDTAGQLGDGKFASSAVPVKVIGDANPGEPLGQISSISAGAAHVCAVGSAGSAVCWGFNSYGQLGNGVQEWSGSAPVKTQFSNVATIAAGYEHTCARSGDGIMSCVGCDNWGELGDGHNSDRLTAVSPILQAPGQVNSVVLGRSYSCAILAGKNTVTCWGINGNGQLGDGSIDDRNSPTQVRDLSGAFSVTAKYAHTCALVGEGTAYCWGLGEHGQLGNASTELSNVFPVKVTSF